MDGGAQNQKHFSLKFSLNWSNGIPTVRQQYEQRTAMELTKLRQGRLIITILYEELVIRSGKCMETIGKYFNKCLANSRLIVILNSILESIYS